MRLLFAGVIFIPDAYEKGTASLTTTGDEICVVFTELIVRNIRD